MKKALAVLTTIGVVIMVLVALTSMTGCKKKRVQVKHEKVKLEKLKPANKHKAQYAYDDDSGIWWYYIASSDSSSSSASYSYPRTSGSGSVTLPPGTWSRSTAAPAKEEIEEEESVEMEATDVAGPMTEAEEAEATSSADGEIDSPDAAGSADGASGGDSSGGDSGGDGGGGDGD